MEIIRKPLSLKGTLIIYQSGGQPFITNAEGNNVTHEFAGYALPRIQGETKLEKEDGLPRFARLKRVFA